jgi:predicted AlkP superfamily phosphohydrolase/phosphomutase
MTVLRKMLVVGVDGGTFDLIRPWSQMGYLPHFAKLLEVGVQGTLMSTIPPITGPAWVSFQTGRNPGQHGIFDWLKRSQDGYHLVPINAHSVPFPTLWDLLGQHGKRVGVINVPVTYPPKPVNGFLITGMLTPQGTTNFTYPEPLYRELQKEIGPYHILPSVRYSRLKIKEWMRSLKETVRCRKAAALYLMQNKPWDFFMVHFYATDLVGHRMWNLLSESGSTDQPILEIYQEVDQALGAILSHIDDDTAVLVMSDHGLGPLYHHIYLNNILLQYGYLKLRRTVPTYLKILLYKVHLAPSDVYQWLDRLGLLGHALKLGKGERYNLLRRFFLSADHIDWQSTRVYSYGNIGQIYLNRLGREPQGIVKEAEVNQLTEELIKMLRSLKHPQNGRPLFESLYRKEEIYSGERLRDAPEILVIPQKLESMAVGVSEFVSLKSMEPSFAFTGGHRLEGIFMGIGKGIKKGTVLEGARIIDLAPTILYALGVPIPKGMDGRVLEDIFEKDILKEHKKIYTEDEYPKHEEENKSQRYQEEIRKRLKGLGYV